MTPNLYWHLQLHIASDLAEHFPGGFISPLRLSIQESLRRSPHHSLYLDTLVQPECWQA